MPNEKFKKWVLQEMAPIKMKGDAPFETLEGRSKSKSFIVDDSHKIGQIESYDVYKHNKLDYILVGKFYDDSVTKEPRFGIIAELSFTTIKVKSDNKIIQGKDAIKISTIQVNEVNRKEKIATSLYVLLLNIGFIVISDGVQYDGAVKLWKSFAKIDGITVYIWDELQDTIISKMTSKTHDNSVWSNGDLGDYSKMSTKLILVL